MRRYGIVILGGDPAAEASSFLPLTSLDAFVTAILGASFLSEPVGVLGVAGMVVAAGGVFLIASAPQSSGSATTEGRAPPAANVEPLKDEPEAG
jgi:drug/metabolite transporter (DMT)-like permease